MIHSARKSDEKDNSVVFGVATDGFEYGFWRIDNASRVSFELSKSGKVLTYLSSLLRPKRLSSQTRQRDGIYILFSDLSYVPPY